jgi:hypothetical protein
LGRVQGGRIQARRAVRDGIDGLRVVLMIPGMTGREGNGTVEWKSAEEVAGSDGGAEAWEGGIGEDQGRFPTIVTPTRRAASVCGGGGVGPPHPRNTTEI